MESVNERWYVGYSWFVTIQAVIFGLLCVAGFLIPALKPIAHNFGWTYTTFAIALATIIYRVFYFGRTWETQNKNFAGFQYSIFYAIMVINLIHLTGWLHSWYLILFIHILIFAGLYGTYTVLACAILITMFAVLGSPGVATNEALNPINIAAVCAGYALCIVSHFIWKPRYIDAESQQLNHLSTLLRSNRQQSEILIQSIADGVIVTDTKGSISLMNPAAANMTQWSVEDASNIDVRSVAKFAQEDGKPLDQNDDVFSQVFVQRKNIERTLSLIGKNGKQHIVSLVISPVVLPSKQELVGAVAVLRDISESRKIEQQRADFISTASHEMRTPVAAIEGYLALALNEHVSKIDAKAREYLEKAHMSTQHLGQLFQDLLTSAKAEDGRLTSHPVVTDMGAFIEQLAEDLRFSAQKKGLSMEFVTNSHEDPGMIDASAGMGRTIQPIYYANVDPDRIREVITNVFDNAVKYTEQGKVSLAITGNEEIVQIRVSDTGPGIPADDIPHLFQKFYRVDNSATRSIGGTGLGLFICRKIVELYNGRIWAESTVGKGSTFFINLPRISAARAGQLQMEQKAQTPVNN